jgi:gas vesicle protein
MSISSQLSDGLSALADSAVTQAEQLIASGRIDGLIIGTGKADFTQGNAAYNLNLGNRTFQLIDVPGIEGDESRFVKLVEAAVAKAHLIVYVNGTNKKPEKKTSEKIKSYLRRGSKVYPLINIRGSADAYEFHEDREILLNANAKEIINQTSHVLKDVLGSSALLPSHAVQGLIGFCALAHNNETATTSIHPDRHDDLARHQTNFLKHFGNASTMLEFSGINAVADVVRGKLDTYQEDIIECNKDKIKQLLSETISSLQSSLNELNDYIRKMQPEFKKCRTAIQEAIKSFERMTLTGQKNTFTNVFTELMDRSDDIVERYFGEGDQIKTKIEQAFDKLAAEAKDEIEKQNAENLQDLSQKIQNAIKRLLEDMQRVELEQSIAAASFADTKLNHAKELGWNLGLSDFGSFAFQIGSYALSGLAIGSVFPVIGNVVGAIGGAVVGVVMGLLSLFTSKEKRIRNAQSEVREKIEAVCNEKLESIESHVAKIVVSVHSEVESKVLSAVNTLENNLNIPVQVLEKQIKVLTIILNTIREMKYGTIETV